METILNEIYNISPLKYINTTIFIQRYSPTYGEVTKECTNNIVNHFKDYFNENTVFYDLGCGMGKMVSHIGLQYNIKKSCGIELSKQRIKCCNDIKEKYFKDNNKISFINDDFLNVDLSDATILYFDNTAMFNNTILIDILNLIPKDSILIMRTGFIKKVDRIKYQQINLKSNEFTTSCHKNTISYIIKI